MKKIHWLNNGGKVAGRSWSGSLEFTQWDSFVFSYGWNTCSESRWLWAKWVLSFTHNRTASIMGE